MIRVLIADNHPVVRQGVKAILAAQPDMSAAGEAQSGCGALKLARKRRYDVVVLETAMPGKSGLDVLRQLKAEHPQLPVLVLSARPEDQYGVRALKAGADGYLSKTSPAGELAPAIRRVCSGGKYVSASLAERLAIALVGNHGDPPHDALTDRELEVLSMIGEGRTVTEVAEQLHLSPKTISTHKTRILRKMGMASSGELVRYAVENGIVG